MKKALCALVFALVLPVAAWAGPVKKGITELSAATSMGFTSTSVDAGGSTYDTTAWNVSFAGYNYYWQNIGLGAYLDYSSMDVDGTENGSASLGPSVKYVMPVDAKMNLYGKLGLGYRSLTNDGDVARGYELGIGGGVSYFPKDWISVNCEGDYAMAKLKESGEDVDVSQFGLKIGLSLYMK